MRFSLSRREFLKLLGSGFIAAGASGLPLNFYGVNFSEEASWQVRYTTCGGCARTCGLRVAYHPLHGWRVSGNNHHPIACPEQCACGAAYIADYLVQPYLTTPFCRSTRGAPYGRTLDWDEAARVLREVLHTYSPSEIAFLVGAFPSDRVDLFALLAAGLGCNPPIVLDAYALRMGVSTLLDAAHLTFGISSLPYFDVAHADIILALGLRGDEPWLGEGWDEVLKSNASSPQMIHLSPRRGNLPPSAEWLPLLPGSEAALLSALTSLVSRLRLEALPTTQPLPAFSLPDPWNEHLPRLAQRLLHARAPLILPGSLALGTAQGGRVARQILELDARLDNLGRSGGVFLPLMLRPHGLSPRRPASLAELERLTTRLRAGSIKLLFVHGVDVVTALPPELDFPSALQNVEVVISLSEKRDATSLFADYLFPDQPALERWGYHQSFWGKAHPHLGALAPLGVLPVSAYSTPGLFLKACRHGMIPGLVARDEMEFIEQAVLTSFASLPEATSLHRWQEGFARGGWWEEEPRLIPAVDGFLPLQELSSPGEIPTLSDNERIVLPLWPMFNQNFARNGAEGIWAEFHPLTAQALGVREGETVWLQSSRGSLWAHVRLNDELHWQVVAVPATRQSGDLLEIEFNAAGDEAWVETKVRLYPTKDHPDS